MMKIEKIRSNAWLAYPWKS